MGWVQTSSYVSWVPEAPAEIYYGYGYYGPHSVNLINVNIDTVPATNVYRNAHVNNAVTVVNHDAFIRGRAVDVRIKENPFLTQRIHAGRPEITPVRETRMSVIRDIPEAKQPPRAIRQREVGQLKESRPVVKDPARYVLRPGTTPKQMAVTTVKQPRTTEAEGKGLQRSSTRPTDTQKSSNYIRSKELQKPTTPPVNREVQRSGGTTTGRSVQTPPGQTSGREIKGRSSEVTQKETGKQGVPQQKKGAETEKEQAR